MMIELGKTQYHLAKMAVGGLIGYEVGKSNQRHNERTQELQQQLARSQTLNRYYARQLDHDTLSVTPGNTRFSGKHDKPPSESGF
jgi:hypothetical protein